MRQGRMTKTIALMLSLVMISSVFVGNTLSRYVTSVSSTDSARVAVWGINGGETQMNLFDTKYIKDGKTIAAANDNGDGTFDKIMAPGTKGEAEFNIINFEQNVAPEVAYQVKISLDDSTIADEIKNNPSVQWKLDEGSFGTWDELKTSILSLAGNETGTHTYAPGQFATAFQGTQQHTIAWQWLLDNDEDVIVGEDCDEYGNCENVYMNSNEFDTYMGNLALEGDLTAVIKVSITAQQTDDVVTNENMLDGANQVVDINNVQPLTFRSRSDVSNFESVNVNGSPIDDGNYEVTSGSTIITLKPEYLATLNKGRYTIEIISSDMIAVTAFSVEDITEEDMNEPIVHDGIIPEGGTYYRGIDGIYDEEIGFSLYPLLDYSTADEVLEAGDSFPETVNEGDVYVYGDYEYRYNMFYTEGFWLRFSELSEIEELKEEISSFSTDGWGVGVVDNSKSEYGKILTTINNKNIVRMNNTFAACNEIITSPKIPKTVVDINYIFYECASLINAPVIPEGVEDIRYAFGDCTSLYNVPVIPNTVKYMDYAFYNCDSLAGMIEINANPISYEGAFLNTKIQWISGSISDELKQKIIEGSNLKTINPEKIFDGGDISKSGIYYTEVLASDSNYISATGIYINGAFPEKVNTGDVYIYGDYEYRFNMEYERKYLADLNKYSSWEENLSLDGWSVRVLDGSKTEYGEILTSINGKNIVSLNDTFSHSRVINSPIIPNTVIFMKNTFSGCMELTDAPVIPSSVIDMESTFSSCDSLVNAPVIPENVDIIKYTFSNCDSLTGIVEINTNPTNYLGTFSNSRSPITLTGTSRYLNNIKSSSSHWDNELKDFVPADNIIIQ